MKLMTKAVEAMLEKLPLGSTEGVELEDKVAVVKFFDPCGRGTWYIFEGERDEGTWMFFGYVVSPLGPDCDEMGYISLSELESVRNRFGLGIERDIHFTSTKMTKILETHRG